MGQFAPTWLRDMPNDSDAACSQIDSAPITMLPPEQPRTDRPSSYTMKTHARAQVGSSQSQTQTTPQPFKPTKSNTPLASPLQPFSVGQPYPPKLSPSATFAPSQAVRTPSPNYFGLSLDNAADPHESAVMPRENWSPQTSSVRSFGTAIPKQMPLDANPEFEAFKRQADANRGRGFSLSYFGGLDSSGTPLSSTPSALQRPRPPRWHTQGNEPSETSFFPRMPRTMSIARSMDGGAAAATRMDSDKDSLHDKDSAYVSGDSKRNSSSSMNPPMFLNIGRQASPVNLNMWSPASDQRPSPLGYARPDPPSLGLGQIPRSGTGPGKMEPGGAGMMGPDQLEKLIATAPESDILILDLRVSPQYAQSRVKGALNLCIPTTLLKRATFNLEKLQTTFQGTQEQDKFASWRDAKHLVLYDAFSSEKRDALSAMNMVKKFANEGYTGSINILRGGFNTFAATFPDLIDSGLAAPGGTGLALSPSAGTTGPSIAPVIGGVMLPMGSNAPNPFFNNIRQNQDLIGGVGQMKVALPTELEPTSLPQWLKEAAEPTDQGKKVSDKFLRIELTEQSRMKDAYSVQHPAESIAKGAEKKVQLSGIEKGGKNRYKDILPFEHARVRLEGRPEGSCDYVNASHLKSSRSHKRYIASQGPLPATFEDFWSVIWDQDVRVIVMLTAESEGGQLKCHPYWQGKEFGPIKLRSLSEKKVSLDIDKYRSNSSATPAATSATPSTTSPGDAGRRRANTTTSLESSTPTPSAQPHHGHRSSSSTETPYVIVRKLALSHAAHPFAPMREITQLHYPSWPDFGAPAQPSHLLALVELANVMQRAALPLDVPSTIAAAVSENGDETHNPHQNARKLQDSTPLSWRDAPEPGDAIRPMLVHCSAGCGRTGAFCTVDSVIDMLKRQRLSALMRHKQESTGRPSQGKDSEGDISMGDDDSISPTARSRKASGDFFSSFSGAAVTAAKQVQGLGENDIDTSWLDGDALDLVAGTVDDFRRQRLSMVQSLRQFVLCYETIIEWVWRVQQGSPAGRSGRGRSGSLVG